MTTARQKRKQLCAALGVLLGVALALSAVVAGGVPASRAAITERIVVDWHTGLAIGGYDPVAYFTDGKPMVGKADLEMRYGDVVWRFCNPGNRAAFAARPDVYMPKFGGYDPISVAHGVAAAGNANVWMIAGDRLYLFYDRDRLEKFAAYPERVIGSADRKWPEVERKLTP